MQVLSMQQGALPSRLLIFAVGCVVGMQAVRGCSYRRLKRKALEERRLKRLWPSAVVKWKWQAEWEENVDPGVVVVSLIFLGFDFPQNGSASEYQGASGFQSMPTVWGVDVGGWSCGESEEHENATEQNKAIGIEK